MSLTLRVLTPTGIALDTPVAQVDFEAIDGFYTLLPRHTDMVSALKAGILTYTTGVQKSYIACNKGVLVKKNDQVCVSTQRAILGTDLKELEQKIATDFKETEEERKEANLAMARLELGLARGMMSLQQKNGGGDGGL